MRLIHMRALAQRTNALDERRLFGALRVLLLGAEHGEEQVEAEHHLQAGHVSCVRQPMRASALRGAVCQAHARIVHAS